METLGDRLKKLREGKGFTAQDVAGRMQIAPSTYREWENGRAIRGEPYEKLAAILGVSLSELLTGKKPLLASLDQKFDNLMKQIQVLEQGLEDLKQEWSDLQRESP